MSTAHIAYSQSFPFWGTFGLFLGVDATPHPLYSENVMSLDEGFGKRQN